MCILSMLYTHAQLHISPRFGTLNPITNTYWFPHFRSDAGPSGRYRIIPTEKKLKKYAHAYCNENEIKGEIDGRCRY